jgi:hypothetical protein
VSQDPRQKPWIYRNVRVIYYGVWVVCLLVGLADFLYHKHVHYEVEELPNFFGFYGFVGCVGLVLAAKVLRVFVMRDEDYYDD